MKPCQYCQKEYNAVWLHERNCKQNPAVIERNKIKEEKKKEALLRKEEKLKMTIPDNLEPDPAFVSTPDTCMSEPEKLRIFLADAPLWSRYRPSWFQRFKASRSGKTFVSCVFVGENRPPRVLYLPYDPEKNRLIIPGHGYYFTPISGEVAFFHEDLMLPIVNAPDLKNRFMLPAHVPMFTHAQGLAEGKAEGFDELLKAINRWQLLTTLACIIAGLALIVAGYMIYSNSNNEANMVQLMTNMTQASKQVVLGGR